MIVLNPAETVSLDPVDLVNQVRPRPSPNASSFVPDPGAARQRRDTLLTTHDGRDIPVEMLDGRNPRVYASRVPPPPCAKCNMDHNPMHAAQGKYDHDYVHPDSPDAGLTVMLGLPPAPVPPVPLPQSPAPTSLRRVSIFPGRGDDDYIVVVECRGDDDWEDVYKQKVTGAALATTLPILDALDIKIKDRTGGDLVEIRQR